MSVSLIATRNDAPQDARQVRSRNALCGAMLELLQETAFDQITIREISARAGTGYATFFRHYPTKEALLSDVASEQICTLMTMTASMISGPDRFGATLDLCNHVDAHRNVWAALLTGGAANLKLGQHLVLPKDTPLANVWLTMLHGIGVEAERHGDSTGVVKELIA